MTFDPETARALQTVVMSTVAAMLVAKVCRECAADALRQRLDILERQLFEFARSGRVRFRDPAYSMLLDSIRSISRFSDRISLTRFLITALFRPGRTTRSLLENHTQRWLEALRHVEKGPARETMVYLREQVLHEVGGRIVLGSLPLGSVLARVGPMRSIWLWLHNFSLRNAAIVEIDAREAAHTSRPTRPSPVDKAPAFS